MKLKSIVVSIFAASCVMAVSTSAFGASIKANILNKTQNRLMLESPDNDWHLMDKGGTYKPIVKNPGGSIAKGQNIEVARTPNGKFAFGYVAVYQIYKADGTRLDKLCTLTYGGQSNEFDAVHHSNNCGSITKSGKDGSGGGRLTFVIKSNE